MKHNNALWLAPLMIVLVIFAASRETLGQGVTSVTGAGAATLPSGVSFNAVSISGLEFGIGIDIDGSATGDVQITLVGTSAGQEKRIIVEGKISGNAVLALGTATFSGTCSIDLDNGTTPASAVPFTMTVTAGEDGKGTLTLVLGLTNLPTATINKGSLTIK